tara:strand:+ start:93 stop:1160 length:1068 start_codon:yes stop_codon:yes gene_type:complete
MFNPKYLSKYEQIKVKGLHGYVLPHAGTKYIGKIISHTLRFIPTKKFNKVIIFYLPSQIEPNVSYRKKKYYHEYLVPWKCFDYFFKGKGITYTGINIKESVNTPSPIYDKQTIYIISADFSHHKLFHDAINLENKAAKSMMFRDYSDTSYNKVVDDLRTFKYVNTIIPKNLSFQWIGRSRSEGLKGVGYLSFLIREPPNPLKKIPNGIFVTVYDSGMVSHECLGEWFTRDYKWNKTIENNLINKVIHLGKTTSRLTGGNKKNSSLKYYTITYLYKKNTKGMIRGWHGIKKGAFYLPDVFLENTHSNGKWFTNEDILWKNGPFKLNDTFKKLEQKSNSINFNNYTLYESNVVHNII